ncbi:Equisetin cluster transcription factor eqxR [Fusarium austroafricanum]|uniref:Equisetin cluster transcription factor eqxR n=1 Tax=Fusarium austroafricanum TaxID=2364996 RepID=A0A8H4KRX5_9HYPO|nr:Equisetin cluster transcription factor eqxR [Fusarium austroafricanum]
MRSLSLPQAQMHCFPRKLSSGIQSQSKRSNAAKKTNEKPTDAETLQAQSQAYIEDSTLGVSAPLPGLSFGSPTAWIDGLAAQEAKEGLGDGPRHGLSLSEGDIWADLGTSQDLNLLDLTQSSLPTHNYQPQFSALDNYNAPVGKEWQFNSSEHSDHTTTTPHIIAQLSALVIKIHETSRTLEEGPWSSLADSKQLRDYPIGRVLSLSQDLSATLSCIWLSKGINSQHQPTNVMVPEYQPRTERERSPSSPFSLSDMMDYSDLLSSIQITPEMSDFKDEFDTPTDSSVAPTVDMPTMLLVLSCYTSLVKLYSLVFAHFESHLSHLPDPASPYTSQNVLLSRRWGLQLGELPSADETCAKVYTAVQVLLDAFQSVEDILGLPRSLSAVRHRACGRDGAELDAELSGGSLWTDFLAPSVFKANGNGSSGEECEELRQLSIKVGSLEALIREKMRLPGSRDYI